MSVITSLTGNRGLFLLILALLINSLPARAQNFLPVPDHIVVVIEENKAYKSIIGASAAPFINSLATQGALFTDSHGIGHPSQPNYLELFSGSPQGVTNDACPQSLFTTPNLGGELLAAGYTFAGYSDDLKQAGSLDCTYKAYARKHNPWADFADVPPELNLPMTAFPTDFSQLPQVAFVVPNLLNDMHDGTIQRGDTWLLQNVDPFFEWAKTHNSLLILTWDEDDSSAGNNNHMPTVFAGPMVKPGSYDERIDHFTVLRTLEDIFHLPYAGQSTTSTPIVDVWSAVSLPGDLDQDGTLSAPDISLMLRMVLGLITPTPRQVAAGDVRPQPGSGGRAYGDSVLMADDLNAVLRAFLGLGTLP